MPNDTTTQLNTNTSAGDYMDESAITFGVAPTTRKRPRVVIGDDNDAAALVRILNSTPSGSEYGVVVRLAGTSTVATAKPGTGTLSSITAATAATTILAANANRLGAIIYNDSTATLYLGLSATTPTTSLYTFKVEPGGGYEIPYGYTGTINGIWSAADGAARVTEFT